MTVTKNPPERSLLAYQSFIMQTVLSNITTGLRATGLSPTCNCSKALAHSYNMLKGLWPTQASVLAELEQHGAGGVVEGVHAHVLAHTVSGCVPEAPQRTRVHAQPLVPPSSHAHGRP